MLMRLSWLWPVLMSIGLLLVGCATAPREEPAPIISPAPVPAAEPGLRPALVSSAKKLLGTTSLISGGHRMGHDCAGIMRTIFSENGIDLYAGSPVHPRINGVRRIYENVRKHGRLHAGPTAAPGDLVFFNNTWDFNADGRANDPLTHVGLVERTDPDGTVLFISRVARAVERYRLNLNHPHVALTADGRPLNDYLRRRRANDKADVRYLTAELFAGFGRRVER